MGCWGLRVESKREQSVREQQLDNWTTGETNDQSFTIIESESLLIGLGLGSNGCWSVISDRAWAAEKVHFCPLFSHLARHQQIRVAVVRAFHPPRVSTFILLETLL